MPRLSTGTTHPTVSKGPTGRPGTATTPWGPAVARRHTLLPNAPGMCAHRAGPHDNVLHSIMEVAPHPAMPINGQPVTQRVGKAGRKRNGPNDSRSWRGSTPIHRNPLHHNPRHARIYPVAP